MLGVVGLWVMLGMVGLVSVDEEAIENFVARKCRRDWQQGI
jgi:hypothetical protein